MRGATTSHISLRPNQTVVVELAGDEAGGDAETAASLHHQQREGAAGPLAFCGSLRRRLCAFFLRCFVGDVGFGCTRDRGEEVGRRVGPLLLTNEFARDPPSVPEWNRAGEET